MSTSSTCSACAHDRVGDRLLLLDAGDPLDDVVHRLEVLDVERRDDVDAGVEELLDVLPALLVPRARDVGVGELVDERELGLAGEDRVDVHLLERRAAVARSCVRGTTSRSRDLRGRVRAPVGLDETRRRRRCRARAAPALVEHGEGLADAGRGAEVDAELAARHAIEPTTLSLDADAVEREVELEHVDAVFSPRKPSPRPSVLSSIEREHLSPAAARARRATRVAWSAGVGDRDVRVEADADAVTASTGTGRVRAEPVELAVRLHALTTTGGISLPLSSGTVRRVLHEARSRRAEVRAGLGDGRTRLGARRGRRGPRLEVLRERRCPSCRRRPAR